MGTPHNDEIEAWRKSVQLDSAPKWPTVNRDDLERAVALMQRAQCPPKLYAVVDGDGEVQGIYSTLDLAAQAMERIPCCYVEERELDKLPDEPEPREPDYNAPSAAERRECDSFDADRGGAR